MAQDPPDVDPLGIAADDDALHVARQTIEQLRFLIEDLETLRRLASEGNLRPEGEAPRAEVRARIHAASTAVIGSSTASETYAEGMLMHIVMSMAGTWLSPGAPLLGKGSARLVAEEVATLLDCGPHREMAARLRRPEITPRLCAALEACAADHQKWHHLGKLLEALGAPHRANASLQRAYARHREQNPR